MLIRGCYKHTTILTITLVSNEDKRHNLSLKYIIGGYLNYVIHQFEFGLL